jgi:hypothetical protein
MSELMRMSADCGADFGLQTERVPNLQLLVYECPCDCRFNRVFLASLYRLATLSIANRGRRFGLPGSTGEVLAMTVHDAGTNHIK